MVILFKRKCYIALLVWSCYVACFCYETNGVPSNQCLQKRKNLCTRTFQVTLPVQVCASTIFLTRLSEFLCPHLREELSWRCERKRWTHSQRATGLTSDWNLWRGRFEYVLTAVTLIRVIYSTSILTKLAPIYTRLLLLRSKCLAINHFIQESRSTEISVKMAEGMVLKI